MGNKAGLSSAQLGNCEVAISAPMPASRRKKSLLLDISMIRFSFYGKDSNFSSIIALHGEGDALALEVDAQNTHHNMLMKGNHLIGILDVAVAEL